jgi:hypothetical protein
MYYLGVTNQYLENIVNSRGTYPEDENFSVEKKNFEIILLSILKKINIFKFINLSFF